MKSEYSRPDTQPAEILILQVASSPPSRLGFQPMSGDTR